MIFLLQVRKLLLNLTLNNPNSSFNGRITMFYRSQTAASAESGWNTLHSIISDAVLVLSLE